MKCLAYPLLSLFLAATLASSAGAVDFEEQLRKLAETNARGYIGPFTTTFGTTMNSGLYHTAKPHGILGFDISAKISLVQVSSEDLWFDFALPDSMRIGVPTPIDIPGYGSIDTLWLRNIGSMYPNRTTPTVFGKDEWGGIPGDSSAVMQAIKDNMLAEFGVPGWMVDTLANRGDLTDLLDAVDTLPTPPGIGFDMMPLVMPQVSVGLPMKTEVLLRFIPTVKAPKIDKDINFLGIGVKHSLSQYIPVPMFPVDISGQFVWQKLTIGDLLESKHIAFNIEASKRLGLPVFSLTPYIGLGIEKSTLDVSYTIEGSGNPFLEGQHIEFNLTGDNKVRATGGVRLGLAMLSINADYSLGAYNCASLGVGLTLR